MQKNKEKFLQHYREICEQTAKKLEGKNNLNWGTVENLLYLDRDILENIFHNLQKLEYERMDLLNPKS